MKTKWSAITKKIRLLTVITCSFLIFLTSCEKEEKNELLGAWKCIGFGNSETQEFKLIEPQNCCCCYKITFSDNGLCGGRSSNNSITWNYKIEEDSISLILRIMTFAGEIHEDGFTYIDAIGNVYAYELITQERLRLFYKGEDFNYLLFYKTKEEEMSPQYW